MRLAIVGSENLKDITGVSVLIDRFIFHHGSKNLTLVSDVAGDVAREVEKFAYARGYNFISLPFQKLTDCGLFFSNVDKALAFVIPDDHNLIYLLKRARKSGIAVMTIDVSGEISENTDDNY